MIRTTLSTLACALFLVAAGCGGSSSGTVVRGGDVDGLDDAAFSTGLDRRDLDQMYEEVMTEMRASAAVQRWRALEEPPVLTVLPFHNETSEHIDSVLNAMITRVESELVNVGGVRVISLESQPELMDQVRRQQGSAYDQSHIATWGQQLGVQFVVDGKVYSADERADDQRRVQYFLFLRILNVSTSEIVFQSEANVTKAIVQQ
ncbi:MAG: penicillin-binding protein activator LpoB [Deltaproteobacteria bacterium]|nr:penicillin-binding protein activator LpoB [Deltaproteobacteria bacterium]